MSIHSSPRYPALLADIGGTNARFTLETAPGTYTATRVLPCADFPALSDAIRAYLAHPDAVAAGAGQVHRVGIAIANPVHGDLVKMTNHHWTFSIQAVQREFGFDQLLVANDFKALAMSLPYLDNTQKYQVGEGVAEPNAAIALLGAGTGLGVSGLVPAGPGKWVALDSEGGHCSFAPTNPREIDILQFAMQRFAHVSTERLLSGAGISLIYQALAARNQVQAEAIDTPEISRRGLVGECALCVETLETFCEILGSMAGNLAVMLGAKGGVYIGGGIVPRLGDFFVRSPFRQGFLHKGRFADYLNPIPCFVITEAYPAFIGIAALLND